MACSLAGCSLLKIHGADSATIKQTVITVGLDTVGGIIQDRIRSNAETKQEEIRSNSEN